MIGVPDALDLDGPYMDLANVRGIRARPVFKIETSPSLPVIMHTNLRRQSPR